MHKKIVVHYNAYKKNQTFGFFLKSSELVFAYTLSNSVRFQKHTKEKNPQKYSILKSVKLIEDVGDLCNQDIETYICISNNFELMFNNRRFISKRPITHICVHFYMLYRTFHHILLGNINYDMFIF